MKWERYERGQVFLSRDGEWKVEKTGAQDWSVYQFSVLLTNGFLTADAAKRFALELGER
jgi:hypothetical protein